MKQIKLSITTLIFFAMGFPGFAQTDPEILTVEKVKITEYPWKRHQTILFDLDKARDKVVPFMLELHPNEPTGSDEVELFKLVSEGIPAPEAMGSSFSTQSGLPQVYMPENDRMDGIATPPLAWLGHARLRMAYSLQNAEGNRLLLNKDKTFTAKANVRKGQCDNTLEFYLYNARFTDIQIGYLEIEAIAPPAYHVMEISQNVDGQTLNFGDVQVEVNFTDERTFYLKTPLKEHEKVAGAHIFLEDNGYEIQSPGVKSAMTYWPVYEYYLNHPDIRREEWELVISQMDPAEFTDMALVYEIPVAFEKVFFYTEDTANHEQVIGSRFISFRKDDDGHYSYTPLWKDSRGVLRPFEDEAPDEFMRQQPPVYIGGMDKMYQEIARTLVYPQIAQENGIEGRVVVSATIDENGKLVDASVLQKVYPTLDEAALDALRQLSDNWTPGTQDGKPVKMNVVIPIVFTLH